MKYDIKLHVQIPLQFWFANVILKYRNLWGFQKLSAIFKAQELLVSCTDLDTKSTHRKKKVENWKIVTKIICGQELWKISYKLGGANVGYNHCHLGPYMASETKKSAMFLASLFLFPNIRSKSPRNYYIAQYVDCAQTTMLYTKKKRQYLW